MSPWRERLRTSRPCTAAFVIAVCIVVRFQGNLAEWLWLNWRGIEVRPDLTTLDTYSWAWLRESFIALVDDAQYTVGWSTLGVLTGLTLCFAATKWLHALSWKDTFAKLGLPRPRRVEFTIPMIACVPGFAFIVLVFWPQIEPGPDGPPIFPGVNVFAAVTSAFVSVLTWGFLYKGLVREARWKPSLVLLLILMLISVPHAFMMTSPGGHEIALSTRLNIIVTSAASLFLATWIFHHWNCRVWVLVFLSLASRVPVLCLPFGLTEHHGLVIGVLSPLPYLLVMIWTWLRMRSESMELVATKTRVHA